MKTVEPGLLDNLAHGRIYLLLIHTYILSLLKCSAFFYISVAAPTGRSSN